MNSEKLLKDINAKVRSGEIKNKKELGEYLTEQRYRGLLTKMHVNSLTNELSKLYFDKKETKSANSKRITRTPQKRYF